MAAKTWRPLLIPTCDRSDHNLAALIGASWPHRSSSTAPAPPSAGGDCFPSSRQLWDILNVALMNAGEAVFITWMPPVLCSTFTSG